MDKRGDANWFMISMIIAVVGFAVLILVIYAFPWKQTIDREACHSSIVLRGTLSGKTIPLKNLASVNCAARKICVTSKSFGNGECTELGKDFETMRVYGTAKERELKIKSFLAREMADCWGMFGEGLLQIFSREYSIEKTKFGKAIVCSKIEFDKSVLEGDNAVASLTDLQVYMLTHKVPNKNVSFMDYLRNTPDGDSASAYYGNSLFASGQGANTDLTKLKAIYYVETTRSNMGKLIGGGIGASVGVVTGFGTGSLAVGKVIFGLGTTILGKFGDVVQRYFDDLPTNQDYLSALFLTDYSAEGFANVDIESFENIA